MGNQNESVVNFSRPLSKADPDFSDAGLSL